MKHLIENRKPIWNALSEFYLDTELEECDYDRVSKILIASNFDIKELRAIDMYEVFPVLKGNLLTVAGEWNGFDQDWLYENCKNAFEKRDKPSFRIKIKIYNLFLGWMRKDHWEAVGKRM